MTKAKSQSLVPPPQESDNQEEDDNLSDELEEEREEEEEEDQGEENLPSPATQPQGIPTTPTVAAELRESIQHLAKLRGTDPLDRAHVEGRRANKRTRPADTSPAPKSKRSRPSTEFEVRWSSDEEDDGPDFRTTRAPPPLSHQPPRATEVQDTTTSKVPTKAASTTPTDLEPPSARQGVTGHRKKRRWSNQEVDWLVAGLRRFGLGNWKSIVEAYPFEGRSGVDLKDKYRNLLKHFSSDQLLGSEPAPEEGDEEEEEQQTL